MLQPPVFPTSVYYRPSPRCLEMGTMGMGRKKCKCGLPSLRDNSLFKFPLPSDLKLSYLPKQIHLSLPTKIHPIWSRNMKVSGDSPIP